ncbi:MAG: hypothetical protein KF836_09875 [Fimbriimonadaceae bacterium]|nr:hypothetical protein [Fimbriimonadaceae bacterium]
MSFDWYKVENKPPSLRIVARDFERRRPIVVLAITIAITVVCFLYGVLNNIGSIFSSLLMLFLLLQALQHNLRRVIFQYDSALEEFMVRYAVYKYKSIPLDQVIGIATQPSFIYWKLVLYTKDGLVFCPTVFMASTVRKFIDEFALTAPKNIVIHPAMNGISLTRLDSMEAHVQAPPIVNPVNTSKL